MAAAGVAGMGLERSGVSRRAGQRWAQGGADHVGPSRPFKNIGSPPRMSWAATGGCGQRYGMTWLMME